MAMEASGKLHTIFDTKQVSERFAKREFVVELTDNPKYPQVVLFQLTGDRCAQLDGLRVGDSVRIEFSCRALVTPWTHAPPLKVTSSVTGVSGQVSPESGWMLSRQIVTVTVPVDWQLPAATV